ncbi:putative nuclease HARBI1 [Portunus trituberculatus]|uniref:Putative nuclease HARBI1 n=1 Tax=Portunus trituberculatus TaxID=210409 RepID=A0A5B7H110_PORTR|nr:putative nuclease HARBI1 [Portunus trituberculatus]
MFPHLRDLDRIHQRAPRRILKDRMDPFHFHTQEEFVSRYRLTKQATRTVIEQMSPQLPEVQGNRGLPIPHHLQVLIALRYMATGSFQLTISDCLEVSQAAVSRCISRVSKAIAMHGRQFIKMPAHNESLQVMEEFKDIDGMPGIVGCIDCTHVVISKPPGDRSEVFRNRKGKFSINVQGVCGPQLQFFNIVTRWPGSAHDSNIFARSRLCAEMEGGAHRGILLGDAGYACRPFVFTPLRAPQMSFWCMEEEIQLCWKIHAHLLRK